MDNSKIVIIDNTPFPSLLAKTRPSKDLNIQMLLYTDFTLFNRAESVLYYMLIIFLMLLFANLAFVYLIVKFRSKIGKKQKKVPTWQEQRKMHM